MRIGTRTYPDEGNIIVTIGPHTDREGPADDGALDDGP